MTTSHIIALGGGGFSNSGTITKFDEYILSVSKKTKPKVLFIPTASGDAQSYLDKFYSAYSTKICAPSHLALFRRAVKDITKFILKQDIIFVGGGNTVNMLSIWQAHGVDIALRKAWKQGSVLSGVSAGAMCWFEGGVTDSYGTDLLPMKKGLGFLKGSFTPHCSSEKNRIPILKKAISKEVLPEGYGVDDNVLLHFHGQKLYKIFSIKKDKKARYVAKSGLKTLQ
jgi:peptidase E